MAEAREIDPAGAEGRVWNIVVMGMGEPLLNYDATVSALRILMDPEGFAITPKRLTLSTVGILPALEKLMAEPVRPNLAISLHAPSAALRRELMPIEEKYRMEDVIAAARRYPIPRGGLVTYEYVMLQGVNDRSSHARAAGAPAQGESLQGKPDPAQPGARDPVRRSDERFGRCLLPHPGRGRRDRLREAPARPGHSRGLRPASPQEGADGTRALGRALRLRLPFRVKLALVLLGACFILFPALGAASLERAEIYFLDGARAMVETRRLARPALPGSSRSSTSPRSRTG